MFAGPHYAVGLKNLIAYYRASIFGPLAAVWAPQLSPTQKALYYVTGPGGATSLGLWAYVGVFTLIVPIIFTVRRHRLAWPAWIAAILTLIAYVVVTVPGNKSPFLGIIFPAYVAAAIILSTAYGLVWLYARNLRRAAYIAALAFLCFGAYVYRFPSPVFSSFVAYGASAAYRASRQAVIDDIASALKSDQALANKTVVFAQLGQYTNAESLTFKFLQDRTPTPTFVTEAFTDDIARHAALLDRADYVIVLTGGYHDDLLWLPSAKIADRINAMVRERFDLAKTIIPPGQPGEVQIYKHRPELEWTGGAYPIEIFHGERFRWLRRSAHIEIPPGTECITFRIFGTGRPDPSQTVQVTGNNIQPLQLNVSDTNLTNPLDVRIPIANPNAGGRLTLDADMPEIMFPNDPRTIAFGATVPTRRSHADCR